MLVNLFFFLQKKINNTYQTIQNKQPSKLGYFKILKLFFLETLFVAIKYLLILFKNPTESFKILVNQPALAVCPYSYTDHKSFQKRLRLFSFAGFTALITATVITSLVLNLATGPVFKSKAASYTFAQTNWAGGATANNATHTSNQSNWTEYSAKDASLTTINGGADLQVGTQTNTWTVTDDGTTDTGFNNAGTATSDTVVSGTGSGAAMILTLVATIDGGTGADGSIDLSLGSGAGGCTGTGLSYAGSTCTIASNTKSVFNFTTISVPSGQILTANGTNALIIKATGNVTIAGTININGTSGVPGTGAPGGYDGGLGTGNGGGTGGGGGSSGGNNSAGGAGHGGAGGAGANSSTNGGTTYNTANVGGSGGGSGSIGKGGGGGGSISITTAGNINVTGAINASGGNGGNGTGIYSSGNNAGGGGSGGRINLVAVSISNSGTIATAGGNGGSCVSGGVGGGGGGGGRIILQDLDGSITGSTPAASAYGSGGTAGGCTSGTNGSLGVTSVSAVPTNYSSPGTFTSHAFDTVGNVSLGLLSWSETVAEGTTDVTIKARSGNQSNLSDATAWGSCTNITSGQALSTGGCVTNGHRYLQFQATLSTTDTSATPTLSDVSLTYTNYPTAAQTLTSSAYNSTSSVNVISRVSWNEDASLPASTTIQFQLRTAPNSSGSPGTWTSFLGPDGTTGTYFSNTGTGCSKASTTVTCTTIPSAFTDGTNDQWMSYKAYLTASAIATPTLSDITLGYVVNAPPQFDTSFNTTGVTATQNSDGTVTIQYQIRDPDTTTGTVTPNAITPSFEYSTNGGTGYSSITSGYLGASDLTNKTVGESTHTLYSATWSPKSQLGSSTYVTNAKIRVTLNDNEAANNTANAATANFTLDTTNPVPGTPSLSVNPNAAIPGTSILTISATDNSSLQMKVGLVSDLSDASWEAYATSKTITLVTNPDTVYAQFKDGYGNTSSIVSGTTPETPTAMMIQDTSNLKLTPAEYRLFSAWKVVATPSPGFKQYNVLRSTDNISFTQIATITNIATNYYGDSTVVFNQPYYYKVSSQDQNNNISFFSSTIQAKADGIQNLGEGGGGADGLPPTISNVTSSNIQTTQATITWTTDELSNSTVGFSIDTSFTTEQGVTSYVTSHSVTLINLTPNTAYKFQVKSVDPTGNQTIDNNSGAGYTFTTSAGPKITNVTTEDISNTTAKIVWNTDTNSSSNVVYSINSNLSSSTQTGTTTLVGGNGPNYYHAITLTNLTQGTNYYYYVQSTDAGNNIATNNNGLNYYTFKTTSDTTSPTISSITVSTTTPDTAVITWTTNEPSTSQIEYGTTANYGLTTTQDTDLVLTHIVSITNLIPNTAYNFRIKSKDNSDNQAVSSNQTFTTLEESKIKQDQIAPTITNIAVASITSNSATITFTTNESCTGTIDYGTTQTYTNTMGGNGSQNTATHTITLAGLNSVTAYNFKVNCRDSSDNIGSSDNQTFTTIAASTTGDTTAPTITNIQTTNITSNSAAITFTSNESCLGVVNYGKNATISSLSFPRKRESRSVTKLVASKITSFLPTVVQAKTNTVSESDQQSKVNVVLPLDSRFRGNDNGGLKIAQATSLYADSKGETTSATSHSIKLEGLSSSTAYHFKIKCSDASNNVGESTDQTFTTLAPTATGEGGKSQTDTLVENLLNENYSPEDIQNAIKKLQAPPTITGEGPQVSDIRSTSAKISWTTDKKSNGVIVYGNSQSIVDNHKSTTTALESGTKIDGNDQESSLAHEVTLSNLIPGTTYHFKAKSQDIYGNITTSQTKSFTTLVVPMISNVEISNITLTSVVINWNTSVITTGFIEYGKDTSYGSVKERDNPNDQATTHTIPLINLEPTTAYHFRIKGTTVGNSLISSEDYTFSTQSLPVITNEEIKKITDNSAKITFTTNIPTDTQILYKELRIMNNDIQEGDTVTTITSSISSYLQKGKPDLTKDHEIMLTDLTFGTEYDIQIKAKDAFDNETKKQLPTFTTGIDLEPPKIIILRAENALVSGKKDKVQSIITWKTDEPATTQLTYQEGIDISRIELKEKTKEDETLTKDHVVVLTTLKPGTVYMLRAISKDNQGNQTISHNQTMLTPKQSESVFQVIIKNLEEVFGWVKKIR